MSTDTLTPEQHRQRLAKLLAHIEAENERQALFEEEEQHHQQMIVDEEKRLAQRQKISLVIGSVMLITVLSVLVVVIPLSRQANSVATENREPTQTEQLLTQGVLDKQVATINRYVAQVAIIIGLVSVVFTALAIALSVNLTLKEQALTQTIEDAQRDLTSKASISKGKKIKITTYDDNNEAHEVFISAEEVVRLFMKYVSIR